MNQKRLPRLALAVVVIVTSPVAGRAAQNQAPETPADVSNPPQAPGGLPLSLKRAVEIAISPKGNTEIQLTEETYKQAKARVAQARAGFLPTLSGAADETNIVRSLGALGVSEVKLPFGLVIPSRVGPYDVIDVRASANETFSFSAIRRYQASRSGARSADAQRGSTSQTVAAGVARVYLDALRTQADYEAAQADVALAEAVLKQAEDQRSFGTGTGLEVTRQKAELSNDQQRVVVVANAKERARLELLRALNLPLSSNVDLTSRLDFRPVEKLTVDNALAKAMGTRPDVKTQRWREDNARLTASSVKYERLPSLTGFGDYGTTGQGVSLPLLPTREYGISLNILVFDGGRMDARRTETESQYRAEQLRTRDLKAQVELDLREALDNLSSAVEEVRVSNEGLSLANDELTQARRRYAAGVTNGLEVTTAQTRLQQARTNQIAALFNYNLSRVDLGQALGDVQGMIQ